MSGLSHGFVVSSSASKLMDESEIHVQSFIIKLWIDDSVWRGTITHVPSGANRSMKNLDEAVDFIRPYLEEHGITKGLGKRKNFLSRWIKRVIEQRQVF